MSITSIKATSFETPPTWAFLERQLLKTMEEAAQLMIRKYTEPGGALYFADDVDDLYELFYNWGLFYAIGAGDRMLDWALQQWNATTRWSDDSIVNRKKHNKFE